MERSDKRSGSPLSNALYELVDKQGIWRDDLLDVLGELRDYWQIDPQDRNVDRVRQAVIANLRELLPLTSSREASYRRQFRRVVEVSFNISGDEGFKEMILGKRRAELTKPYELQVGYASTQNYINRAINQIEEHLTREDYKPVRVSDERQSLASGLDSRKMHRRAVETTLIERRDYVDKVAALALAGHRLICLWGEAGTGKSTLARLAAEELAQGGVIATLRAADRNVLEGDVVEALMLAGLRPESWSDSYCRAELRQQLATQSSIGAIIVDNVIDESELWQFIPHSPATPILLTSRTKPQDASIAAIELGEFTDAEAATFMEQSLPECSELDRQGIATLLGRRPLALDHAVRFLNNTDLVSSAELIMSLGESITNSLSLIELPVAEAPRLVRLYEMVLASVMVEPAAREVLDSFIAATGNAALCDRGLLLFTMRSVFPNRDGRLRLASGVRCLENYGIIRDDGHVWAMHPLTWKILRELRGAEHYRVSAAYLKAISSFEATAQDPEPIDHAGNHVTSMARTHYLEIRAATDLCPGWLWLFLIDLSTWVALREQQTETGETYFGYVRYDVVPNGVLRHDYTTGTRRWIELEEGRQLYRLVMLYQLVCAGSRNKKDEPLDPTDPEYTFKCIERILERGETATLRLAVRLSKSGPLLYKDLTRSNVLAARAAALLQQ